MSLIRELAQIVTDAEIEYKRLLESGVPGSYRMELRSAAGGAGGASCTADSGVRSSGQIYHADNLQLLADGIRSGELLEKLNFEKAENKRLSDQLAAMPDQALHAEYRAKAE